MGCNIHGYLEVKQHQDYDWEDTYGIRYDRSYYFYAAIADVRNYHEITPIDKPRGLPKDVARGTKYQSEEMGGDGHSHSYLYANELRDYDWEQEMPEFKKLIDSIDIHHRALLLLVQFYAHHYGDENVRIVFWFDN